MDTNINPTEPRPEKQVVALPFWRAGQTSPLALAWTELLYGKAGENRNAHRQ